MEMNKYIVEYWKSGYPHKRVVRYAPHVTAIKNVDYIFAWSYKVRIYRDNKLVLDWTCD